MADLGLVRPMRFPLALTLLALAILSGTCARVRAETPSWEYTKKLYNAYADALTESELLQDFPPGDCRVSLSLAGDGSVRELHPVSNTSDKPFADQVLRVLKRAKFPAPPAEFLEGGVFRTELVFSISGSKA